MAAVAREKLSRLFTRVAFVFEPAAGPRLVNRYVKQRLEKWKQDNRILAYKTRTKRLGKFHYKTQIDMELSSDQAAFILDKLTKKLKK